MKTVLISAGSATRNVVVGKASVTLGIVNDKMGVSSSACMKIVSDGTGRSTFCIVEDNIPDLFRIPVTIQGFSEVFSIADCINWSWHSLLV